MAKPTAQQCHALTSYFITLYNEKYKKAPVLNRNKARWGFDSILMDYTPEQARTLLDFYVNSMTATTPSLEWFLFNYEKVEKSMSSSAKDAEDRARLRKESEKRAAEWRARGNQGIANN